MKTLLAALCTAGCVFALASAWSDILQPHVAAQQREAVSRETAAPRRSSTRTARSVVNADDDDELPQRERPRTKSERPETVASEKAVARITPVAKPNSEVEALLREQADEATRQEARVKMRQESLRLIYDDIREQQASLDDIRRKATDELAVIEQRVVTASQREVSGIGEEPPLRRNRAEIANVKAASQAASAASPTVRATVLMIRQLVAQGNRDTAVNCLNRLKEREAAKVLAALAKEDEPLASALMIAVQASKQAAKPN